MFGFDTGVKLLEILPLMFASILVFIFGILLMSNSFAAKIIQRRNEIRGVKTKITPITLKYSKIMGVLLAIVSAGLILGSLVILIGK